MSVMSDYAYGAAQFLHSYAESCCRGSVSFRASLEDSVGDEPKVERLSGEK